MGGGVSVRARDPVRSLYTPGRFIKKRCVLRVLHKPAVLSKTYIPCFVAFDQRRGVISMQVPSDVYEMSRHL